ncbi:hypothetical protein EV182_005447, partial [Spiromyces aspiralis]
MLIEEKWRLEDIAKKSHRFTYLWCKAHGQYHNDEQKTRRYLEALPDELVWATIDDIHNGTELRTFEEVVKVIVVRAKRILNIQYNKKQHIQRNIPQSDVVSKSIPFEAAPCPQDNTADTAATAPAPTVLAMLKEQLEELALQVKELLTNSTKATTISRPCLYCDQQGHTKRQCKLLTQDLRAQIVRINHHGKLTNLSGEAYRLNMGRGGIRTLVTTATSKLVRSEPVQSVTSTATATVHREKAPVAATHDRVYYIHRSDSNRGDLPRIGKDERIVRRVPVEVDPVGAFSDGGLPGCTIGTYVGSKEIEERPAAMHPVGAPKPTFPIAMGNTIEKQSTVEERLAAGQIGDSGLSKQEVTYTSRQHRPVAEDLADMPTDTEILSATNREPDKVNTIPRETWKERPYLCPRAQEGKILTSSEKKRSERRTIAETCLLPSGLLPQGSKESPPCQAIDTDEEKKGATQERYERGGERRKNMLEKTKVTFGDSCRVRKAHGSGSDSLAEL